MAGWEVWIDRGGTFTDVVARDPGGRLHTLKLLSEAPDQYADAAVEAISRLIGDAAPGRAIDAVKMGTTVATNALLERKGEATLLVTTAGLGDVLRIGDQSRPKIFARRIVLPTPLYAEVLEVAERVTADGEVLKPLDEAGAREGLRAAFDRGLRAVAVVLMHGWRFTAHEARLAEIAREIGFTQVTASHDVGAVMKLVPRGDTAVVDAYLSPVLRRYVERVAHALGGVRLMFMQSNGGLVEAGRFRGRDAVLSGPAGGIVGMVATAARAGIDRILGFDMGGTSTDVSHYAGVYERADESRIAGVRLRAPMLRIHTVAAGGGSVCRFDGARFRVGPESAGADPGPACYRRGGPLTVTDCNVLLGRIQPDAFPSVFGPNADQPIDVEVVRADFRALADTVARATGRPQTAEAVAEGFLTIAVDNMAAAIRQISIQRGYDVSGYTLACFGGAGGQHACRVAEALGVDRVMIHPLAGVLSAYGMGLADLRVVRETSVEEPLDDGCDLDGRVAALEAAAREELVAQGLDVVRVDVLRRAALKYAGTDSALEIDYAVPGRMRMAFEAAHRRRFGFVAPDKAVTVERLVVEAVGVMAAARETSLPCTRGAGMARAQVPVWFEGGRRDTPLYDRAELPVGWRASGPAIVVDASQTAIVEPGWTAEIDAVGNLMLTRSPHETFAPRALDAGSGNGAVDPVRLELFANLFMAVAEQMGLSLQNTAYSVNIKERLDFSCALFDASGALIANAPHIPVHLGSMGEGVKAVMAARAVDGRGMRPGDAYMLNAPYHGGTHLPDITVIMPVFVAQDARPAYFVAARGHHADIGGTTPGSMPPDSTSIEQEGVLIDNVLLADATGFKEAEVRALLARHRFPARNPDQNIGDLKAQLAACVTGANELLALVGRHGRATVDAYMSHVQDNAEAAVRAAIGALSDGRFRYEMDDGAVVCVRVTVDAAHGEAKVDFTGTSDQAPGNFNAPWSICRAAVLYVFRTLVEGDMPLNDGCMRPIELIVPQGCLLNPRYPAAVVAGNVETSQVVVDALYGALGVQAASQGTMNNFTFGDRSRQYYETICGGAGAGPGYDGASAVQTHMTNSRLTDPEVLESRYPVVLERFAVRADSGGEGGWRGGDGVERQLRFRAPMTAAILANRRRVPPFGLAGGRPGACGRTQVLNRDGTATVLDATASVEMAAGDAILIETPGGGGFGTRTPPVETPDGREVVSREAADG